MAYLRALNEKLSADFLKNLNEPLNVKLDSLNKLEEEWEEKFVLYREENITGTKVHPKGIKGSPKKRRERPNLANKIK